tara:strand:+ start:6256 stop:7074 length:819 start_codon:yes stop_codon:yes gene_type:complete
MSQTQVLEKLKSDNSLNKEKIKNLQLNDGIFNDQLQILTRNVSAVKDTVEESVSNSLLSLDIGNKPETTIHEHRYYGVAPTSDEMVTGSVTKTIQFHGFQLLKDGLHYKSVVDAGATYPVSTAAAYEKINLARINLNLEPSYQQYHTSGDNINEFLHVRWTEDTGWGDFWNNTKTPIIYTRAYSKISPGSLLEVTSMWLGNNFAPASGHIVSAATPSGPWVIRYSWDHRSSPQVANYNIYQEVGNLSTNYVRRIFNKDDTVWSVLESLARLI